ncbi:hypothetical protein [Prescottella agglutinans]|uniref:PDGLE domain-containing protein n=1 Tax=Prescottella agglutinans TaxID=1644129 RepID=A0ABT6MJZ7_9NOCA|nr:hypothetical protein [Prescottella agglutinans]MDH6284637.1 hypothetical protein [Prescottella agglutinans]
MTPKTRNLFAGLAAVAAVLVVGGIVSDRRATEAYSQCVEDVAAIARTLPPLPPDPEVLVSTVVLSGCEDANRGGLVVAVLGLVVFVATTVIWWLLRRSAASRARRE